MRYHKRFVPIPKVDEVVEMWFPEKPIVERFTDPLLSHTPRSIGLRFLHAVPAHAACVAATGRLSQSWEDPVYAIKLPDGQILQSSCEDLLQSVNACGKAEATTEMMCIRVDTKWYVVLHTLASWRAGQRVTWRYTPYGLRPHEIISMPPSVVR